MSKTTGFFFNKFNFAFLKILYIYFGTITNNITNPKSGNINKIKNSDGTDLMVFDSFVGMFLLQHIPTVNPLNLPGSFKQFSTFWIFLECFGLSLHFKELN